MSDFADSLCSDNRSANSCLWLRLPESLPLFPNVFCHFHHLQTQGHGGGQLVKLLNHSSNSTDEALDGNLNWTCRKFSSVEIEMDSPFFWALLPQLDCLAVGSSSMTEKKSAPVKSKELPVQHEVMSNWSDVKLKWCQIEGNDAEWHQVSCSWNFMMEPVLLF